MNSVSKISDVPEAVVAQLVFRLVRDEAMNQFEDVLRAAGLIHREAAAQESEQRRSA